MCGRGFLTHMANLLRLMNQPAGLRRSGHIEILELGPYCLRQPTPWPSHVLSIVERHQVESQLGLPLSRINQLDLRLRCPLQGGDCIAGLQLEICRINAWLPLGGFALTPTGTPVFSCELPLQNAEMPVTVFVEALSLLLQGYARSALRLQALTLAKGQVHSLPSLQRPLAPIQKVLTPRPRSQANPFTIRAVPGG